MVEKRKSEHIDICAEKHVSSDYNFWNDVFLVHNALPELDKGKISLSSKFLGVKLGAPIIISAMTGGFSGAKKINENLAAAAAEFQIGLGVGSQRAALAHPELAGTYSIVKEYDVPLRIANIGAPQILEWGKKAEEMANKAIEMIGANCLAIHLNFLQEAIQPEGETKAKGALLAISDLAKSIGIPVVVKETGAGISGAVAKNLCKTKIAGIDVAGIGGTSFSAVEHYRLDESRKKLGKTFWNWGIPAPASVLEVRKSCPKLPIIASGGITNGLDCAKALAIGADTAGIARAFLRPALLGTEEAKRAVELTLEEMRIAMFLVGAKDVKAMKGAEYRITGASRDFISTL
ncbi:MAG: type 2 isopentenyl-diphosphate Delta-isomerase [Candidatus Thermoplasmatota archaeon]|nr:type 2 isopentenyl-diphosphate Delta-isomerase [Candidatus Thermoplasmatota archaeon]